MNGDGDAKPRLGRLRSMNLQPARPVLVAVAALAGMFLFWQVRGVFLLLFGGLIAATALNALAAWISRHSRLSYRASVALSVLAIVLVVGLAAWWIGGALV